MSIVAELAKFKGEPPFYKHPIFPVFLSAGTAYLKHHPAYGWIVDIIMLTQNACPSEYQYWVIQLEKKEGYIQCSDTYNQVVYSHTFPISCAEEDVVISLLGMRVKKNNQEYLVLYLEDENYHD